MCSSNEKHTHFEAAHKLYSFAFFKNSIPFSVFILFFFFDSRKLKIISHQKNFFHCSANLSARQIWRLFFFCCCSCYLTKELKCTPEGNDFFFEKSDYQICISEKKVFNDFVPFPLFSLSKNGAMTFDLVIRNLPIYMFFIVAEILYCIQIYIAFI